MTFANNRGDVQELAAALATIAHDGILLACRAIEPGDEELLDPAEAAEFSRAVLKVRRQSGAARALAKELLKTLGVAPQPVLRGDGGAPLWPDGVIGSMAHDREVAVAAIARARSPFAAIGVDVEPDEPLTPEILSAVAEPGEMALLAGRNSRLLFCAKEAAFKAIYSACGAAPEFRAIFIDFTNARARTRDGVIADLVFVERPRLVALATVR